jgi:hypothetical protein
MRKIFLVIFVVFAVFVISGEIYPNAYAANTCLACHGSADVLKTMISDDDFNKPPAEGGYG